MSEDGSNSSLQAVFAAALDRGDGEALAALVSDLPTTPVETRKACVQSLRSTVDDGDPPLALDSASLARILPAFEPLLTDEERSVRLTTAKLFVAVAESNATAVVPLVSALADRLADDEEFYYVRARSAEALGYVALDHPETVTSPEMLADLTIGLSFDKPEVKEKLAKALEHVALGNPGRLTHHVSTLADHLNDEDELVRYHLSTALVVVGCEYPERLIEVSDALGAQLADENAHVRGRAAEAFGLLARSAADMPLPETLAALADDEESFAAERARFALVVDEPSDRNEQVETGEGIGTVEAIRATTDGIVAEITAPDGDGECPHCGLALSEGCLPICPRCGAPC